MAALADFAAVLQQYSDAQIAKLSFLTTRNLDIDQPTLTQTTETARAWVQMRDGKHYRQVIIPVPKVEIFNQVSAGVFLKTAIGEAITNAYNQASGEACTFDKGQLWDR